jgi:hypothetical protein
MTPWQTLAATATLLAVLLVPLLAALLPYAIEAQKSPESAQPAPAPLLLLTALGGFWILAILARIVKSAFEWDWLWTILFTLMSAFVAPWLLLAIIRMISNA